MFFVRGDYGAFGVYLLRKSFRMRGNSIPHVVWIYTLSLLRSTYRIPIIRRLQYCQQNMTLLDVQNVPCGIHTTTTAFKAQVDFYEDIVGLNSEHMKIRFKRFLVDVVTLTSALIGIHLS